MARKRYFRRARRSYLRTASRVSRGARGTLERFLHTLTNRPIKVAAGAMGIATLITMFMTPDSNGYSVQSDIVTGIGLAQSGDTAGAANALGNIPLHVQSSITSGQWIGPAIGTVILGAISKWTGK